MGCDSHNKKKHLDDNSAGQMTPKHDLSACDIEVGKGESKDFTCSKCAKNNQLCNDVIVNACFPTNGTSDFLSKSREQKNKECNENKMTNYDLSSPLEGPQIVEMSSSIDL